MAADNFRIRTNYFQGLRYYSDVRAIPEAMFSSLILRCATLLGSFDSESGAYTALAQAVFFGDVDSDYSTSKPQQYCYDQLSHHPYVLLGVHRYT